jgi:hypothetical protein
MLELLCSARAHACLCVHWGGGLWYCDGGGGGTSCSTGTGRQGRGAGIARMPCAWIDPCRRCVAASLLAWHWVGLQHRLSLSHGVLLLT